MNHHVTHRQGPLAGWGSYRRVRQVVGGPVSDSSTWQRHVHSDTRCTLHSEGTHTALSDRALLPVYFGVRGALGTMYLTILHGTLHTLRYKFDCLTHRTKILQKLNHGATLSLRSADSSLCQLMWVPGKHSRHASTSSVPSIGGNPASRGTMNRNLPKTSRGLTQVTVDPENAADTFTMTLTRAPSARAIDTPA